MTRHIGGVGLSSGRLRPPACTLDCVHGPWVCLSSTLSLYQMNEGSGNSRWSRNKMSTVVGCNTRCVVNIFLPVGSP